MAFHASASRMKMRLCPGKRVVSWIRREAHIETGGIEQVKEGIRAVRAGHYVEVFAGDIHYAHRGR